MILPFAVFFGFTFALLPKKGARRIFWVMALILTCISSCLLAYVSISSTWTPHPWTFAHFDRVLDSRFDKTEGVFPWAKLSYPLYLSVYHSNATWIDYPSVARGQVQVNVLFANVKIFGVNGTYSTYDGWWGKTPVYYHFDFIFSDPDAFFDFLVVLLTLFNIIGALLGMVSAKALRARVGR
jgi:hypothetical protein